MTNTPATNSGEIFDALVLQEQLVYKRVYEYRCVFCKKKRKTRKRTVAKIRMCNACKRQKVEDAFDARQIRMF